MAGNFSGDLFTSEKFVVTLELVPGRESSGRTIDTIKNIADEAYEDGRISAVSITDNPGGNPALSPDVLGREIVEKGMDVIVHFTCRDTNRVGMESRALQLAHMGMKNILALTGDYLGKGFRGSGAPVFDFDSVILISMLKALNERLPTEVNSSDLPAFTIGCAVSPFKYTEAESWVQYRKLERKIETGASFIVTQLGYDVDKYQELLTYQRARQINTATLASLLVLNKRSVAPMHTGKIPGVHVSAKLFNQIISECQDPTEGMRQSVERSARLAVILKGIGYRGIHLGGIHGSFEVAGRILDRMAEIEEDWQDYLPEFQQEQKGRFYLYPKKPDEKEKEAANNELSIGENCHYLFLKASHNLFFKKNVFLAPFCKKISQSLHRSNRSWVVQRLLEDPVKLTLLSCKKCGDCGIQHVGFLCPESGCPKHIRNGPCGGSCNGYCEVEKEQLCVWVRAYRRMKKHGEEEKLICEFIPPRLWELNDTSSWINFHLDRDHQKRE